MADTKITALTAISTVDPAVDVLPIVDVSDTTMAASGTTKKITSNQILGAGGTATLASATITGDLTVATNRLSVSSTGVQIGTTTNKTTAFTGNGTGLTIGAALAPTIALWDTTNASYVGSISQIDADMYLTNTAVGQMVFSTDNTSRYTISSTGVATWSNVGGVAGTAMTLNSTGLGVGRSPSYRFQASSGTKATTASVTTVGGITTTDTDDFGIFFRIKTDATAANRYAAISSFDNGSGNGPRDLVLQDLGGNVGVGVVPSAGRGAIQLSAGVGFPATQVASSDANTLDDYEEGTWTPTVSATSGTLTTTTVNAASYTKIGRLVSVQVDISIVNIGTASGLLLFSLPTGLNQVTDANVGALRELGSTGSMGQIIYQSATQVAVALYNNGTLIVNGYRFRGTYTYTTAT
jgi:hypothetical protein